MSSNEDDDRIADEIPSKRIRLITTPTDQQDDKEQAAQIHTVFLPTEVWTDTFKLLSRKVLLNCVQPVCKRFNAIAELNVPSVHVIKRFDQFLDGLAKNNDEANEHFAQIGGSYDLPYANNILFYPPDAEGIYKELANKHFKLVGNVQFRFSMRDNEHSVGHERRLRVQRGVLGQVPQLLLNCHQLELRLHIPDSRAQLMECVAQLPVDINPFNIRICVGYDETLLGEWDEGICVSYSKELVDELLLHPIVLNCPRLTFVGQMLVSIRRAESIYHWLHHLSAAAKMQQQDGAVQEKTRILNLHSDIALSACNELIEQCKENFLKAETLADRRAYLLIFHTIPHAEFHLKNARSGEELRLEALFTGPTPPFVTFRLQRYLPEELDATEQYYDELFNLADGNVRTSKNDDQGDQLNLTIIDV